MGMSQRILVLVSLFAIALVAGCGGGGGDGGGGTPQDTTSPTITNVVVEPSGAITSGMEVTVRADVTDDSSGVDAVAVEVTYPNGSKEVKGLALKSGSTYEVKFTVKLGGVGQIVFVVSARDKAGNLKTADRVVREAVDRQAPSVKSNVLTRTAAGAIVVEAEVTDEGGSGVKEVWLEAAGIAQAIAMQPVSGKPNTYRVELTQETGRLRVRAVDGAGNATTTDWMRAPAPNPPQF